MDSFPGRLTDGTFNIWLNITVVILKRLIWHWCGQAASNRETQCDSMDNRAKAKPEPCWDRPHVSATIWGQFQVTPLRWVLKSEGFCFQNNENVSLIDLGDSPADIPSTEQNLVWWCQIFHLGWEFFKITMSYFLLYKNEKLKVLLCLSL